MDRLAWKVEPPTAGDHAGIAPIASAAQSTVFSSLHLSLTTG